MKLCTPQFKKPYIELESKENILKWKLYKSKETQDELVEIIEYKNKELERLNNIIKEVREKVNNFDVFKEFTFPLMKRDVENQVKSSIDYEWRKSVKKPILEILDKVGDEK